MRMKILDGGISRCCTSGDRERFDETFETRFFNQLRTNESSFRSSSFAEIYYISRKKIAFLFFSFFFYVLLDILAYCYYCFPFNFKCFIIIDRSNIRIKSTTSLLFLSSYEKWILKFLKLKRVIDEIFSDDTQDIFNFKQFFNPSR